MAKPQTFEESVEQLEKIVQAIESGQIGLEESLARYEQGMELVKRCRSILDRAEKRIEVLSQNASAGAADGSLTAHPLDPASMLANPTPES